MSMQKVKGQIKVTEAKTQLSGFQTVTPVLIQIQQLSDAKTLIVVSERCLIVFRGHPSKFKVTQPKSSSFWPKLGVSGLELQFEFNNGYEVMH